MATRFATIHTVAIDDEPMMISEHDHRIEDEGLRRISDVVITEHSDALSGKNARRLESEVEPIPSGA